MPPVMLARVTCPSCQNQFQAPIEQIVDVRQDPSAKMRVLNGLLNVATCPHCGMGGALSLPILYHDPDKELALIFMPMQAGRDDLERQRLIGELTSSVMNDLPPEDRKGYLLQPQVYLTLENLVNKILEADGVTPEMIAEQKAKAELIQRMLEATSETVLEAMIKENDDVIDATLLRVVDANLEIVQASGQPSDVQRLVALRTKLLELSSAGQVAKSQGDMLEALRAEPTRDKLVDLLIQAPDEQTRGLLVTFGRPLLDYLFFQSLTSRIESAPDENERDRLTALRAEVLEIRDRLDEQTRMLYEERSALLRDLLLSDDPETLARRRFQELDQAFLNLLAANLEEARSAGENEAAASLQAIWRMILGLVEETLPPELRLFNRLMSAKDSAEIDRLIDENRDLVTDRLVQYMEETEAGMQEEGSTEAAEHLALVLEKARRVAAPPTDA